MSKRTTSNNLSTPVTVDFQGDPVICIKNGDGIKVAMRPIAEKLGLEWTHQLRQIKNDPVLASTVAEYATVAADGKPRKMITLPLDYLNGWLFKIDAGRYKKDDPRRDVIIRYQRECYRVLHDYWHKGEAITPQLSGIRGPIVPLGCPEHYVPTELLTDKILEWVLAQTDPFDFTDVMRGTGASSSYAQDCLHKFARRYLIQKGNDKYYRLTEKALVMVKDKEKVGSIATIPTPAHPHSLLDRSVPARVETQLTRTENSNSLPAPPFAMAPYARAMDLDWNGISLGPHSDKLKQLRTRLVGKTLYFFPVSWLAEALDMPIDTIKGMLDPKKFEIFADDGEVRKWFAAEGIACHPSFKQDTFITTFGLQRLMQVRERKTRRTTNILEVRDIFNSFLEIAKVIGMERREAIAKANAATLKLTGMDCLKLLE